METNDSSGNSKDTHSVATSVPTRSDHAARREALQGAPAHECGNSSIASMDAPQLPAAGAGAHAALRDSSGENAAAAAAAAMASADTAFERYSSTDNVGLTTPLGTQSGDHATLREARRGPHECSNASLASMGASQPNAAGPHALLRESFGGGAAAASAAADAMRRADTAFERYSSTDNMGASAPAHGEHAGLREARRGQRPAGGYASMGSSQPMQVSTHAVLRESFGGGTPSAVNAAAAADAMRRADNAFERYSSTDNMGPTTPLRTTGDHAALREARRGPHECSNASLASLGGSVPKNAGAHALLRESFGGGAAAAAAAADAMRRADFSFDRMSSVDNMGASAPTQGELLLQREGARPGSKFACSFASMGSSQPMHVGAHRALRAAGSGGGSAAMAAASAAADAMRRADNAFDRYSSTDNMGTSAPAHGEHATLREARRGPHEFSNNSLASMGASQPKAANAHAALRESFGGSAVAASAAADAMRQADLHSHSSTDHLSAAVPLGGGGDHAMLRKSFGASVGGVGPSAALATPTDANSGTAPPPPPRRVNAHHAAREPHGQCVQEEESTREQGDQDEVAT